MNYKNIDCITFFDNNLMFDLRYNILKNYVDYFVICESKFDHKNKEKTLSSSNAPVVSPTNVKETLLQDVVTENDWPAYLVLSTSCNSTWDVALALPFT